MCVGRGVNSHRMQEVVPGGMSPTEPCNQGFGPATSVNTELPIPIGIGWGKPLIMMIMMIIIIYFVHSIQLHGAIAHRI